MLPENLPGRILKLMQNTVPEETPPVCSYEGSDYQSSFWDRGERKYEDAVEEIALRRLLERSGRLMLELGAGAGRNTPRYAGWDRVVLLDYSRTQLLQARERLGESFRFVYVAADVYHLPFVAGLFDGATLIRTLHHLADPALALKAVRQVMTEDGTFILEFANKRNFKSVLRYFLGRQSWDPFDPRPIEFTQLNFDFHPKAVRTYLTEAGFSVQKQLSVSHFRAGWLKRHVPLRLLVGLDALLQWSGSWLQYSPSIFTSAMAQGASPAVPAGAFFGCPICRHALPETQADQTCPGCGHVWTFRDGIYEFRVQPEA